MQRNQSLIEYWTMNNKAVKFGFLSMLLLVNGLCEFQHLMCQSLVEREFDQIFLRSSYVGSVRSIAEDPTNNLVYYGGAFKSVGEDYQDYALLNSAHDSVNLNFPRAHDIDGEIIDIAATPSGWYLGGDFTGIKGDEIKYLAFIDSTGEARGTPYLVNNEISKIHVEDSIMVLAGDFTSINGAVCGGLAVINLHTEEVLQNIPAVRSFLSAAGNTISDIDIEGTEIFLSGSFRFIGDDLHWYGARVDLDSGNLLNIQTTERIKCAEADGHGGWYFGGNFQQIGDSARGYLAHVDSTGNVSDFKFDCDGVVNDLVFMNDTLYLVGEFEHVNGIQRRSIAAIDCNEMKLTDLYGNFDGWMEKIVVHDDSLFVSGDFSLRESFILELSSQNVLHKTPHTVDGEIHEIVPDGLGGWFWFGDFTEIDNQSRNKAAHVNQNGLLSSWKIDDEINIQGINDGTLTDDGLILLAGDFEWLQAPGNANNLIALSSVSGDLVNLNHSFIGDVHSLATNSNQIFIGGEYNIEEFEELTTYLSVLDADNFELESFVNQPSGSVTALAVHDDYIYVSGNFTVLQDGQEQHHFTRYNLSSLDADFLDVSFDDNATSFAFHNNLLFALGNFDEVNGVDRNELASINLNNMTLTSWSPEIHSVYQESEIFVLDEKVYVSKLRIQEPTERLLRRFELNFGFIDETWNPDFYSTGPVAFQNQKIFAAMPADQYGVDNFSSLTKKGEALNWHPGNHYEIDLMEFHNDYLYCITEGNLNRDTLIRFGPDGARDEWGTHFEGDVYAMDFYGDNIYFGGQFSLPDEYFPDLAQYSISQDELVNFNLLGESVSTIINHIEIRNDTLFCATRKLNEYGSNLTLFDLETNEHLDWQGPSGADYNIIDLIALSENALYLDGLAIGGQERKYTGSFDYVSGDVSDLQTAPEFQNGNGTQRIWAKSDTVCYLKANFGSKIVVANSSDGEVIWSTDAFKDHHLTGDSLIVGGNFTEVDGQPRFGLAALKLSDGSLLNWSPLNEGSRITDFYTLNEYLVIRSTFGEIFLGDDPNGYQYGHVDLTTGEVVAGLPDPLGTSVSPTSLFQLHTNNFGSLIEGDFASIGTIERNALLSRNTETGEITDWNPIITGSNSHIDFIVLHGDSIYFSGDFSEVNGETRNDFASVHRFTGEVGNWNPSFGNQEELKIGLLGDDLFFRGDIGNAFGAERNKAALVDLDDFSLKTFNLDVYIHDYAEKGDTIFVGGNFSETSGELRDGLAAFRISTNELLDWHPTGQQTPPLYIPTIEANDSLVFIREYFDNGFANNGVNAFDMELGDWVDWSDSSNCNPIGNLLIKDSILFVSGYSSNSDLRFLSLANGDLSEWNVNRSTVGAISFDNELLFHGTAIYEMQDCDFFLECTNTEYVLEGDEPYQINPQDLIGSISSQCGDYEVELSNQVLDCSNLGINSVEVTASDQYGNSASCVSQIDVLDLEPPAITCFDTEIVLNEFGPTEVEASSLISGVSGACDIVNILLSGQTTFDCEDIGETFTIEVQATDLSGNQSICESQIEVLFIDDDGDGIDNACDLCFGNNSSGDSDGDGICDDSEIVGCLNPDASNFNPLATDPGLCSYLHNEPPDELTEEFFEVEGSELGEIPNGLVVGSSKISNWAVTVFPNPIQGNTLNVHIQDIDLKEGTALLSVIDVNSKIIQEKTYSEIGNSSSAVLQFELESDLSSGIYLLRVEIEGQTRSVKILK